MEVLCRHLGSKMESIEGVNGPAELMQQRFKFRGAQEAVMWALSLGKREL